MRDTNNGEALWTDDSGLLQDNDDCGARGEVALWRAVITQSLQDAGSNSKKPEMRKAKAEAIAWLAGTTEAFDDVCMWANLSPDYVRKKSKEAIARGCVWREVNMNSFTKNRKQKKPSIAKFQTNVNGGVTLKTAKTPCQASNIVKFDKKCH